MDGVDLLDNAAANMLLNVVNDEWFDTEREGISVRCQFRKRNFYYVIC